MVWIKLWGALHGLFGERRAVFYQHDCPSIGAPGGVTADMAELFELLRDGIIHPVVIDRLPLVAAREVRARIDAGGLSGKTVLPPWHGGLRT